MQSLLLEIGTEEIPAGYIQPALKAISENLVKRLDHSRITHGTVSVYGTPRRLVVMIDTVASRQKASTSVIMGPPERIGFDENGRPTVAALKFAEKFGVPVSRLQTTETEKGRYLCAHRTERGLATTTVLKTILPEVIKAVPFPKTMRWADFSYLFARPIHSVLALLGDKIVSFTIGGRIKSSRYTRGHMFNCPGRIKIDNAEKYVSVLRTAGVIVDLQERKTVMLEQIRNAARDVGGEILQDDELTDVVNNLVEFPIAAVGKFDDAFLELPGEVLITAMREHQKYFAVVDRNKALMPFFVAVNNTRVKDMALVAKGHERVLRARLSDARFFFKSDLEDSFKTWTEKLSGVMFQASLGTMGDKTARIKRNAEYIAHLIRPTLKESVTRAAGLCKADLVSQIVVEFPRLQGIMGRVYARSAGEPDAVALAIEEHYRPVRSGGKLPETDEGAILAIADKMDSICGCFSVGLVPTGASDPYALRRQGIGIVQILADRGFAISIKELIEKSLEHLEGKISRDFNETVQAIHGFIKKRISHLLVEKGYSKDTVSAVVSTAVDDIPDVWRRVDALERLKGRPDFEPLTAAFKRAANIIRQSDSDGSKVVNKSLFEHPAESRLLDCIDNVKNRAEKLILSGEYEKALTTIATLRETVDEFFIGVKVMADDHHIKENRLALLGQVVSIFGKFADFSKISV